MKINNLEDIKRSLSNNVTIAFIVIFLLSIIAVFLTHQKIKAKIDSLNTQQIQSLLYNYQSNLSEKLSIIASSSIFIDYLRSGSKSRENLLPEFLYQIRSLRNDVIKGMSIDNINSERLFFDGIETSNKVVLKLCYLNRVLNSKFGACSYKWTLFFDKQNFLAALQKYDNGLSLCEHCKKIDLLVGAKLGSFDVDSHIPIMVGLNYENNKDFFFYFYLPIISFMLVAFALWNRFRLKIIFNKYIAKHINHIREKISSGEKLEHIQNEIQEFSYLIDQIESWKNTIEKNKKKEKEAAIGELVNQILHDIRSPISVINAVIKDLEGVDNKKRLIINNSVDMLNGIANGILNSSKTSDQINLSNLRLEPIICVLDNIISEKRIQFAEKAIDFNLNTNDRARNAFVRIDYFSFKRAINNLLDNAIDAVEATLHNPKNITVTLKEDGNTNIQLLIEDNGCGIHESKLSKVLSGGESNKLNGHGIGLQIAKKFIQDFGGKLELKSVFEVGTAISIIMPREYTSLWCLSKLSISRGITIVVLDDDNGIHMLWDSVFKNICINEPTIKIEYFCNVEHFLSHYKNKANSNVLFLIDYDLSDKVLNGLSVIEQLEISSNSILVTGIYENTDIRAKAERMGVKLVPKNYIQYIPIEVIDNNIEVVLLDDHESVTNLWKMRGELMGKRVAVFNDLSSFMQAVQNYSKDVAIYLDSDLNIPEQSGENIALLLHKMGYKNLFIASGYCQEKFNHLSYIKGIVGKEPPF